MQQVFFTDLGVQRYQPVWNLQEKLLQANVQLKTSEATAAQTQHHLLFVEHTPVYTLGKSGKKEHILITEQAMADQGIEYFHINRGGDITFHGLQQVVGYPILDLDKFKTDLGWYLRSLEEVIILTMAQYGLKGMRSKGETGVWLDADVPGKERKICAMGIKCSRWITMHGFAFNINTNLAYFNNIVPCGIENKQVTSLQKELGQAVDYNLVKQQLLQNFERVFEVAITPHTQNLFSLL